MRRLAKRIGTAGLVLVGCLLGPFGEAPALESAASEAEARARVGRFLQGAEKAAGERDRDRAFFYIARYVGASIYGGLEIETERLTRTLDALDVRPTAFLSPAYTRDFVDWFVESTYPQWGGPDESADEEGLSAVLSYAEQPGYAAAGVVGYPVVQAWSMLGSREEGLSTKDGPAPRTILHVVDMRRRPVVFAGTFGENGTAKRYPDREIVADGYIHSFYPPTFFDFDGDGRNELCLRYTVLHGNGFRQQLDIFRFGPEALEPFRSFSAGAEGVARVGPDGEVLVSRTFPSEEGLGHLFWDRTGFESFRFRGGDWVRVSERSEPNVLHGRDFGKYFGP